ncbi:MAG: LON peptidase substrate-binding domain-containing protein, partial [Syntrophobacterales bacterium]
MVENAVTPITTEEEHQIPQKLPVLPLHHGVLFPELTVPLLVSRPEHIKLIDDALVKDRVLAAVAQRDENIEKPSLVDLFTTGVAVFILKMMRTPEGPYQLLIRTSKKIRLLETVQEEPYLMARVEPLDDLVETSKEIEAMVVNIRNLFQRVVELSNMPDELGLLAANVEGPYPLVYLVASNLNLKVDEAQEI